MSTLQNFYNPEPPSNKWPNIILIICVAILFGWIFFCISACNTSKKVHSKSSSSFDSSSYAKIDSSAKKTETTITDSAGKKTWDNETVIEFDNGTIRISLDPTYNQTPISEDDFKVEFKSVKKFTRRSTGTDTASHKKLTQKAEEAKKKEDKGMQAGSEQKQAEGNKETSRPPAVLLIFIGVAIIAALLLYFMIKKKV